MDQRGSNQIESQAETERGVDAGSCEEAALPRDAYALLAQANLLRVRGHWEDAAEKCMAALRLAPDSASANSLLGDIYENQGRYDDAAQWYRMALDTNPDSPADRLKLDRLGRHDDSSLLPPAKTSGVLARLRRDPEFALRFGAIAAALGLFLVIAGAYRVAHQAGALRALGFGGDPVVSIKPVVVPPMAGSLPADPDGAPAHDPSEQALLMTLQGSPDLSKLGIAVYDVQVDPRVSRMTMTFSLPVTPGMTQSQVTQAALRVLQAAAAGQSADAFTARCLLVPPGKTPTLVFAGDASREALQTAASAGAGLTDAQALAVFSNTWWSATADIRA